MQSSTDIDAYIPARDAALRARLHPDYIARLARQSRIKARRIGRKWYVEQSALDAFLAQHSEVKEARRREMRQKHKKEYLKHAGRVAAVPDAVEDVIAENASPRTHHAVVTSVKHANLWGSPGMNAQAFTYAIHPGVDLLHRLTALMTACILVFGIYGLFDREFGAAATAAIVDAASTASAFAAVTLGFSPDCTSGPQRMAAAAHVALGNLVTSIDNALPSGLPDAPLMPMDSACTR